MTPAYNKLYFVEFVTAMREIQMPDPTAMSTAIPVIIISFLEKYSSFTVNTMNKQINTEIAVKNGKRIFFMILKQLDRKHFFRIKKEVAAIH